jgi:hypothetical protein
MTFDWQTEYARALNLYGGDTPSATLEQDLLDAFTQHPQAVTNAITKIGKAYAAGRIHSPWGALRTEIPKQVNAHTRVGDGNERSRAIANSEQWMRTAGIMFDRFSEVEDELYGDRGRLRPWANDRALKQRLEQLWNEQRPIGETIEADELERAQTWKTARAKVIDNPPPTNPEQALARLRTIAAAKGAPAWHAPSPATSASPPSKPTPSTAPSATQTPPPATSTSQKPATSEASPASHAASEAPNPTPTPSPKPYGATHETPDW